MEPKYFTNYGVPGHSLAYHREVHSNKNTGLSEKCLPEENNND